MDTKTLEEIKVKIITANDKGLCTPFAHGYPNGDQIVLDLIAEVERLRAENEDLKQKNKDLRDIAGILEEVDREMAGDSSHE